MDTKADLWRRARYNQHVNAALATRYHRLELWTSIIVAICGSGSIMGVVATKGDTTSVVAAIICSVLVAVRPLAGWSRLYAKHAEAVDAWRRVEEVCEDGDGITAILKAQRDADKMEPIARPLFVAGVMEWAYALTNRQLPPERFA